MSEDQFLRLIQADLDDTTTLAAYADWLEERDDPRAEYVRLVHQARTGPVRMTELAKHFDRKWVEKVSKGLKSKKGNVFLVRMTNGETQRITASSFSHGADFVNFYNRANSKIGILPASQVVSILPEEDGE